MVAIACIAGSGSRLPTAVSLGTPEAAVTALEITYPNSNTNADNRCFWFDQEKLYCIPIGVWGGSPWYTFSLDSGPGSIDNDGYLNWTPDASTTSATWVVRVTDRLGTSVTHEFSAAKDNARFKYLQSGFATGGRDGSSALPWATFAEVLAGPVLLES